MNKNSGKALIVFLKYPENGNVKTRLAETSGREFAAKFYRFCCEKTFTECLKLANNKIQTIVFANDKEDLQKINNWTNNKFPISLQKGDDLGDRMYNSFDEIFEMNNDKGVIIGTDVPDISAKIIQKAFDYLDDYDFVLGPASDGGYYLLGLKKLRKDLFSGINWSTPSVFEKTIEKIKKNNMSLKVLQHLLDIDTENDLNLWLENNANNKFAFKIRNVSKKNF